MESVLVTGGAGYIGSHICKALAQAGYTPITFDNLSRGHEHLVKWGPLVRGDITDPAALNKVFSNHDISAVIHCAALTYVGESVEKPDLYHQNNVSGTRRLLDAMRAHAVNRIVFSSSCAVYGQGPNPLDESCPLGPCSPYGWTKLHCEEELAAATWCKVTALRYFNAAGADPDGETYELHDPETHLIPLALKAERLSIFGTDYDTPDGTAVRDYLHVTDLAQAHICALTYDGHHFALNLGSGHGHSVLEVINQVEQTTDRKVNIIHAERRAGDPPILVADNRLARSELGWTPTHSDLQTVIETARR